MPYSSGERGRGPFEHHAGEPMQSDELDQPADVGLRAAQEDLAAMGAQPPCEYRKIDHERGVGEPQLGEVDNDIRLRADRTSEGRSTRTLRDPILVSTAAKNRGIVIEDDDGGQTYTKSPPGRKHGDGNFRTTTRLRDKWQPLMT